jgi:hypothetical protein
MEKVDRFFAKRGTIKYSSPFKPMKFELAIPLSSKLKEMMKPGATIRSEASQTRMSLTNYRKQNPTASPSVVSGKSVDKASLSVDKAMVEARTTPRKNSYRPRKNLHQRDEEELGRLVTKYARHAVGPSTRNGNDTNRERYLFWCQLHKLNPNELSLERLTFYVVSLAEDGYNFSGISGAIWDMRKMVEAQGDKSVSFDDWLTNPNFVLVKNGLVKQAISNNAYGQAKPISFEELMQLILYAESSARPDDMTCAVICVVAFTGLHRLGELTVPDDNIMHESDKDILRSSFKVQKEYLEYELPRSKVSREPQRILMPFDQFQVEDGKRLRKLVEQYVEKRDASVQPTQAELWLNLDGSRITRRQIMQFMDEAFDGNLFRGHSFRSGGATQLALFGFSIVDIKSRGRWSSSTWERYVKAFPDLVFAANASGKKDQISSPRMLRNKGAKTAIVSMKL